MKAILIDPRLQRVSDIELAGANDVEQLRDMRRLIGSETLGHSLISNRGDSLWCDDTILARGEPCYGYRLGPRGNTVLLAGLAIVVGADRAGNSRPPYIPIEQIQNDISWLGEILPEVVWTEEEREVAGRKMMGVVATVTYSRPRR